MAQNEIGLNLKNEAVQEAVDAAAASGLGQTTKLLISEAVTTSSHFQVVERELERVPNDLDYRHLALTTAVQARSYREADAAEGAFTTLIQRAQVYEHYLRTGELLTLVEVKEGEAP